MSQEPQPSDKPYRKRFFEQRREDLDEWTITDICFAAAAIVIVLIIASIAFCGYWFELKWTGIVKPERQTFWDWLGLLIVPIVLALGGYLFNRSENRRAKQQTKLDREVAFGHRQDDALQTYLNRISELLIDKDPPLDQAEQDNHLRTIARAWTLTVLETLTVPEPLAVDVEDSGRRKRRVLRFLYEAGLIGKKDDDEEIAAIVNLSRASLVDADLSGANLRGVDLSGTDLGEADLHKTDLRDANLEGVRQRVEDSKDNKKPLTTLTNEELVEKGPILTGATMPEGQKYEVWVADIKGRGEDQK